MLNDKIKKYILKFFENIKKIKDQIEKCISLLTVTLKCQGGIC
jgi:hypothetical protein